MSERSTTRKDGKTLVNPVSDIDHWESCPPGTLKKYAAMKSLRLFRQRLATGGIIALVSCILVGAPFLLQQNGNSPAPVGSPYGGLSCREVVDRIDAFFASTIEATFRHRILQHLRDCPSCKQHYERTAEERNVELASLPVSAPMRPMLATPCQLGPPREFD